ncbi:hypothetical protein ENBRE01_2778 [Enteropsectra breve]|nr:hypothetical protein ENBRE01_2778 [Enteropsectra breve]
MVLVPKNITEQMKITHPKNMCWEAPHIEKIEISAKNREIHTMVELNDLLSSCNLPRIEKSDTMEERAEKLNIVLQTCKIEHIAFDYESLKEKLEKIAKYKRMESECDKMETELAQAPITTIKSINTMEMYHLEKKLEELKTLAAAKEKIAKQQHVFDEILAGTQRGLDYLSIFKNETEGAYMKEILKNILRPREENWCKIIYRLLEDKRCEIEGLSKSLGIERVELLKIIYSLSSKGIIEYERISDSINLAGLEKEL